VLDESVKLKEENMTLPAGGRIKKSCENTLLSWDNISLLANNYKVANNCMVYPTSLFCTQL
jgi:hypothetical protein